MEKNVTQALVFEQKTDNVEFATELTELELAYVGGGIGDVTWS